MIAPIKRPNTGPYNTVEEQLSITLGHDCSLLLMPLSIAAEDHYPDLMSEEYGGDR